MDPIEFGQFDLVISNGGINGGASALQWGPDGLLYAVGRNGFVYAIDVEKQTDAQGDTTGYTGEIKWSHTLNTPNFDDTGAFENNGNRQALGIVVTEDDATGETVVYASHSDIKIGAGGGGGSGDVNLDTNSGVVTRIRLDTSDIDNIAEVEALDLIRGLPRSEENHATNGLELTTDGDGNPILLIASGGHANAGAPSVNFVGLPEYTYSAAVLSADLNALAAIEAAKKSVDPNIDHVFDLPTLDDPTRPNFTDANGDDVWIDANFDEELDSVAEFVDEDGDGIPDWMVDQDGDNDVDADDVADFVATKIVDTNNDGVRDTILYQEGGSAEDNVTGVRGGNDALNQAKLLVGNPVQIFSTGYRNLYDVLETEDGRFYAYDNGANGGWGGVAVTQDGVVTNAPNNVNQTNNFDNLHEFTEGYHAGHPNPIVASGADAGLWTSPTTGPNSSTTLPIDDWRQLGDTPLPDIGQEDDGLVLPADWDEVVDQELINPLAGVYNEGGSVADGALDADKGSWNGLAEYTGTAFGGQLQGAILVTKTGGDVKWIKRDSNGNIEVVAKGNGSLSNLNTTVEAADQGTVGVTGKGNTLGIDAVGDDGVDGLGKFTNTIWVGSLGGGNKITVFEAGGEPAGADLDKDDDGIDHVADYYEFSAAQGVDHLLDTAFGTTTTVNAGETRTYNLSAESYSLSGPGGIGQLGFMVNLEDPSAEGGLLTSSDAVIPGGAGSGLQIKDIRSGTAKGTANDQKDALTFAVTPGADAGRLEISTLMNAVLTGFYQDGSEAGLQIGTGDQFSFMSLVLAYSDTGTPGLSMDLHYEDGDVQQASESIDISDQLETLDGIERLPSDVVVEFLFDVDTISGLVTPKFKIIKDTGNPPAQYTEFAPVQATGNVLDALQGNFVANGQPHPLAFGNIGTSAVDPDAPANLSEDDNVNVTYDEFKVVGFAPQIDGFVTIESAAVDEDAGTVQLTVALEDEFGAPITLGEDVVIAYTLGGDAQAPDDATVAPGSPLTIASGTSSATVTVALVDDDLVEGTETLQVALGTIFANGLAVQAKAGADVGTVTIADNDVPDPGSVLYRVNAGTPNDAASVDGGPDWLGDVNLVGANATGVTVSGNTGDTFSQGLTNQESEMDLTNLVTPVPWQLFINERGDNNPATPTLDYAFDVTAGASYTVTLYYAENWNNIFTNENRIFDVALEGSVPAEFEDIHPLREATDAVDGPGAPLPTGNLSDAEKQPYLGTAFSKSVTYTATDDELNLSFVHNSQNPKINAIEISVADPGTGGSVAEVSVADVTVNEGDGTATVTFSLSAPVTEGPVTVPFTVTDGSASTGIDFSVAQVTNPLQVVFDGSQTATATFLIADDDAVEGDESFTVAIDEANIAVPAAAAVTASASASTATVTIADNDTDASGPGAVLYRVNVGGPAIVVGDDDSVNAADPDLDWGQDQGNFGSVDNSPFLIANSTGPSTYNGDVGSAHSGPIDDSSATIPAGTPTAIFNTERYDQASDPEMKWEFAVAPDTEVEVRLYFAELFGQIEQAGQRVFDVEVEGTVPASFDDIDPFATAGAKGAFMLSHQVTVADGTLDLEFIHDVENPALKGIEIVAVDAAPQEVTITAQDVAANESTGEITIAFSISAPVTAGPITVPFTLVGGTADVTADLTTPSQDGSITFPAGDGSDQTVVITLVNDDLVEVDETFTVQLGTPTAVPPGVTVTTVDGTATIVNDDVAATIDSFNGTDAPGDDWSDDNTQPDDVTLNEGTNTLVSAGALGDADYITFTVAEGQQVTAITLADYAGGGNAAFLGIQQGESVPTQAEIEGGTATLDGGTVYNVAQEGQDILPLLASSSVENAGQPTNGLSVPLQAGTYTLWFNQNQDLTETTLEIVSEAATTGTPDDIDGDGIANTDDPFAYDGTNGDAKVLTAGGEFTQDFDTDTTDPFGPEGGFSGILVNPAFDPAGTSETDPYGDRTSGAPDVEISGGSLSVLSKQFDAFPPGGTNPENTLKDGYQSAVDVSGATLFEVHARASSPDWLGKTTSTNGFEQFGITLGAGGVDDFVKLVLSDNNNSSNQPQRLQIAHNNSLVGGEQNYEWGADGPTVDLDLVGEVEFRLIVDRAAGPNGQIVGQVDFFASADGQLLESFTTPAVEILADSSLLAAMDGQNPLTGGDGGLAYGIFVSDWGGNGGATANQITADYDFLTVRSLDAPTDAAPAAVTLANVASLSEDIDTSAPVKVADIQVADDGISPVTLGLSGTPADVALFEIVGTELFLKAGTALDFETQSSFDVSVVATDAAGAATSAPVGEIVTDSDTDNPPAASIAVTANGDLTASTTDADAFQITNDGAAKITSITIDLSTAVLPDMVFDPTGAGGDGTGLGLTATSGAAETGFLAPANPTGQIGAGSTSDAFLEENGIVVIEMESAGTLPGAWQTIDTYSTATAPNVNDPTEATGGDFIIWQAGQSLGNPGNGLIEYEVEIQNPGLYQFQWRNQVGLGTNTTEHNDTWLKIEADQFYGIQGNPLTSTNFVQPKGAAPGTFPAGSDIPEGSGSGGWFKVYSSGANDWSWVTKTSDNDAHDIFAQFDNPGTYTIQVSQRSSNHAIDRMVLHQVSPDDFAGDPESTSLAESPKATTPGDGPFSQPREGGFDQVTLDFDDFDQGETFGFSVDVDPNSIQGETGTGDAGTVSGAELVGATVTITYDTGETDTVTLHEDGSIGGAVAVSATDTVLTPPTITLVGFGDAVPDGAGRQQAVVDGLDQTIEITGTPDAYFSLLQIDGRLIPGTDGTPFNVGASELPFYANEATAGRAVYTGQFDANGQASVAVTLLETATGDGFGDGGVNHFVAVTSNEPYQPGVAVSAASNAVVATFDPDAGLGGAAVLTINEDSDQIQISNFASDAFSITNTGTEAITFIEIDVTDAVLVDAVFDPFGLAGDGAAKPITISDAGGTGVVTTGETNGSNQPIFGQGSIGTNYIGTGGIAGFETIRLEFDDFDPGETISFGVDMDPNSIAGAQKGTLDSGAALAGAGNWDVGGVAGAELSGSLFTVGYADGGTSTGKLHGQGTGQQTGAKALSAEDMSGAQDVTLTVNGLAPGAEGVYGTGGPQILIQGEAGQVARVLVAKGFIVPFTNEFPDTAAPDEYHDQLDAQLAALEASGFPANNAVEMLYLDVALDGTVQDISGEFDFTQVSAFDLSGPDGTNEFGVLEEDKLPLGIVASVIDPTTDLPQGEVTSPIHLVHSDAPAGITLAPAVTEIPETGDTGTATTVAITASVLDGFAGTFEAVVTIGGVEIGAQEVTLGVGSTTFDVAVPNDNQDTGTTLVTVTLRAPGGGDPVAAVPAVFGITEDDGPVEGATLLRINAFGPELAATDGGPNWLADTEADPIGFFGSGDGSAPFNRGDIIPAGSVQRDADLPGSVPSELFELTRSSDGPISYDVALSDLGVNGQDGEFRLNLFFAESAFAPGSRVFDILVEDALAFDNFDASASFGVDTGGVISTTVTVTDGELNLDLLTGAQSGPGGVQNPIISGIEIVEVIDDAANVVTIAAASGAAEPDVDGQFVVTLSRAAVADTVVAYTVTGSAAPDTDYTALPGTVTIPAGLTSAVIDVAVLDDAVLEGAEEVTVTLDTVVSGDADVELPLVPTATVAIADDEAPPLDGSALIEITPDGNLGASTFAGSSFQVTNTGPATITRIEFDLSTGILPDMVFDPVGAGGDATASVLTPNSGAAATGFVAPADPAVDPFSQARNGGFDVMTLEFTDFDQNEQFFFTVDVDPNSIQDVPGAGFSGAVSGYELIGSTVTITFSDGSSEEVVVSSLYDDGSLGGAQGLGQSTLSTGTQFAAPTITLLDGGADESATLPGDQQSVPVGATTQVVRVTGEAGANVSLLQMDARLFIASGADPFDVQADELPFYANEAMSGKTLYDAVIGSEGFVDIEVTLLETPGSGTEPDGGLNHFVAVLSDGVYAPDTPTSQTSNTLVVVQSPDATGNTAPAITSPDTFDFAELKAGEVFAATATDAEGDTVTFDISGGEDASLFSVDPATGAVSFTAGAPEFAEGGDNFYAFDLTASDGDLSTIQTVTVEIVNDTDGDGFHDREDNATLVANPDQLDSDEDGFGNIIDGDFTQDGSVDLFDLNEFAGAFGTSTPIDPGNPASGSPYDITGDGFVDLFDLNSFSSLFGQPVDVAFDYGPNA